MTSEPLKITILGRPATKKNSQRAYCTSGCPGWRRGQGSQLKKLILPSDYYEDYEKSALKQLMAWGNICFPGPVKVDAKYWMPNKRSRPDLVGLLQATADILEKSGLITNDRNIVSWADSCIMGIDRDRPRVEITITEE